MSEAISDNRNAIQEDELDTSWIVEQKKILTIEKSHPRESIKEITFQFFYTDLSNSLVKTISEQYLFRDNNSVIPKEDLEKIIDAKKMLNHTNYILTEYATYIVDLEPENIQSYAKTESQINFMSPAKTDLADIICSPSIFIFHSLNTVFMFFKEIVMQPAITTIQSILKKSHSQQLTKKRVKFHKEHSKTSKTK
jgi:hypothetical protein